MGIQNIQVGTGDNDEFYPKDKGINDIKSFFGSHFNVSNLDWNKLFESGGRVVSIISSWAKNHRKQENIEYFETFLLQKKLSMIQNT